MMRRFFKLERLKVSAQVIKTLKGQQCIKNCEIHVGHKKANRFSRRIAKHLFLEGAKSLSGVVRKGFSGPSKLKGRILPI